jgi:hypothetical protein
VPSDESYKKTAIEIHHKGDFNDCLYLAFGDSAGLYSVSKNQAFIA